MIDEERGCEDVTQPSHAVRSSLDKVISLTLVTQNLLETIESKHNIELEDIDMPTVSLLTKMIKNKTYFGLIFIMQIYCICLCIQAFDLGLNKGQILLSKDVDNLLGSF